MDPLVILLLVVFVGFPVLSIGVLLAFARTADFEPVGIEVRGGTLRGAIAGAVAKVLVGDAKTFQLPLVVTLRKVGALGAATPLIGGAIVRDIEWRIHLDGEHVSTVTEAASVGIATRQRELKLPVNAEVHLPRGLLGTWRKYRQDKRLGREVRLDVRGHVIVKHWWMTREVPVRITRHIVVGEPRPEARLRWQAEGEEPATAAILDLRLRNPYRDETLTGDLRIDLVWERRLRRDLVIGHIEEPVHLAPGNERRWRYRVTLPGPKEGRPRETHAVAVRLAWQDETLTPLPDRIPGPRPAEKEGAGTDKRTEGKGDHGADADDEDGPAGRSVRLLAGPFDGDLVARFQPRG